MKKILIVDDSSFMRNILKDILNDKNLIQTPIELFEAGGKSNALNLIKTLKPDVILLDIVMRESETEGIEFIREIKDRFNVNKIIIISSIGQATILQECKELGVKTYLQKPFEQSQVIEAVNNALT